MKKFNCTQHGLQPREHFYFEKRTRRAGVIGYPRCKEYMNTHQMKWYWKMKKDPKKWKHQAAVQKAYWRKNFGKGLKYTT